MGWIIVHWKYGLKLNPYQTDRQIFIAVKVRQPFTCVKCHKKIPKGSYGYGGDWIRLCLNCGEKFSHEALKGIKSFTDDIKANQKLLKLNKDEWETKNILAKL